MSEPTDEQITAFKAAWHKANAAGLEGERVRMGLQAALADVVVIPRDAIPDGLVDFLDGWAKEIEAQPYGPMTASEADDARRLRTAARLLSGGSPAAPEDGTNG